ncbi:MAG: hypothetical protein ACRD2W_09200 [Acidimicrobiales bacterium]
MRVVMLGKGGSGKSTLAGLLCVELTGRGERVVAIDADTVPGLAQVLGMEPSDDWDLANMAIRDNGGWRLDGTPAEIVDRCSRPAPAGDNLRFLQCGNVDAGLKDIEFRRETHLANWSGTIAFNSVSRQYDDPDGWSIVDLQGGTLQVAGGMAGTKGVALLIVEPFAKSTMTARRFVGMGEWPAGLRLAAVANKVSTPEEAAYVEAEMAALDVPIWTVVPADPALQRAERDGRPLVTIDPEAPARQAIARLADRLHDVRQPVP